MIEERNFKRGKLPGKYATKMLYEWDDRNFEKEYLRKLERNWQKWKSVSLEEKSQREGVMSGLQTLDYILFFLFYSLFIFISLLLRI